MKFKSAAEARFWREVYLASFHLDCESQTWGGGRPLRATERAELADRAVELRRERLSVPGEPHAED